MTKKGASKEEDEQLKVAENQFKTTLTEFLEINKRIDDVKKIENYKELGHEPALKALQDRLSRFKADLVRLSNLNNLRIKQSALVLLHIINNEQIQTIQALKDKSLAELKSSYPQVLVSKVQDQAGSEVPAGQAPQSTKKKITEIQSQPTQDKTLVEEVKEGISKPQKDGQPFSALTLYKLFEDKIMQFNTVEFGRKPEEIIKLLINKARTKEEFIAPTLAQLSVGMGEGKDIYCMIDMIKARIMLGMIKKDPKNEELKRKLEAHLEDMGKIYFINPKDISASFEAGENDRAVNITNLQESAQQICSSSIDDLLKDQVPLFGSILGDAKSDTSGVTIFANINGNDIAQIQQKDSKQLQKQFDGELIKSGLIIDMKIHKNSAAELTMADKYLKKMRKENEDIIRTLRKLLSDYKAKPSPKAIENLMKEIESIERNDVLIEKVKGDVELTSELKKLFESNNFSLPEQKVISTYLIKKTKNDVSVIKHFNQFFESKIKGHEELVIKKFQKDNLRGKAIANDLREHIFGIIKKIEKKEFDDLAWSKRDGDKLAPNVYELSTFVDKLTKIIKQELLLASDSERPKIFEKYCYALVAAIDNHDTGIISAIGMALTSSEIERLHIFDKVPRKEDMAVVLSLGQRIASPFNSYKFQRAFEKEAEEKATVRGISTFLGDLTFAQEGNLDSDGNVTQAGKEVMSALVDKFFSSKQAIETHMAAPNQAAAGQPLSTSSSIISKIKDSPLILDSKTMKERSEEIVPSGKKSRKKEKDFKTKGAYLTERLERVTKQCIASLGGLEQQRAISKKFIDNANAEIEKKNFSAIEIEKLRNFVFPANEVFLDLIANAKAADSAAAAALAYAKQLPMGPGTKEAQEKLVKAGEEAKKAAEAAWTALDDAKALLASVRKAQSELPPAPPKPTIEVTVPISTVVAGKAETDIKYPTDIPKVPPPPPPPIPSQEVLKEDLAFRAGATNEGAMRPRAGHELPPQADIVLKQIAAENQFLSSFDKNYEAKKADPKALMVLINTLRQYSASHREETRNIASALMLEHGIFGKPESTFVKQLLSGVKDPTRFTQDIEPKIGEPFLPEDYLKIGRALIEFVSPQDVFNDLQELYESQKTTLGRQQVLRNAESLLISMIQADTYQEFFPDFNKADNPIVQHFNRFLTGLSAKASADELKVVNEFQIVVRKMSTQVSKELDIRNSFLANLNKVPTKQIDLDKYISTELKSGGISKDNIHNHAQVLADDLRSVFVERYLNIKPSDIHDKAWTTDEGKNPDKNGIAAYTSVHSNLSYKVIEDIVSATTVEHQTNIVLLYLRTLDIALKNGDFATASMIRAAFQNAALYRLLPFFKQNEEINSILAFADNLFDDSHNRKNYRDALEEAKKQGKFVVPFLGTTQTDFIFAYDQVPETVSDPSSANRGEKKDGKILNIVKMVSLGKIFGEIGDLQGVMLVGKFDRKTNIAKKIIKHNGDIINKELFEKSKAFYSSKPVKLDNVDSLTALQTLFPDGVHTNLRISIDDKEFTGVKAFEKILEIVLPLMTDAQLLDKDPKSKSNAFLLSMKKWADDHDCQDKFKAAVPLQQHLMGLEYARVYIPKPPDSLIEANIKEMQLDGIKAIGVAKTEFNPALSYYKELVHSEIVYLNKLALLIPDVRKKALAAYRGLSNDKLEGCLNKAELEAIFKILDKMKVVQAEFLQALQSPDPQLWKDKLNAKQSLYTEYLLAFNGKEPPQKVSDAVGVPPSILLLPLNAYLNETKQRVSRYQMQMDSLVKQVPVANPMFNSFSEFHQATKHFAAVQDKALDIVEINRSRDKLVAALDNLKKSSDLDNLNSIMDVLIRATIPVDEMIKIFKQYDFSNAKLTFKINFENRLQQEIRNLDKNLEASRLELQKVEALVKEAVDSGNLPSSEISAKLEKHRNEMAKIVYLINFNQFLLHKVVNDKVLDSVNKLISKADEPETSLLKALLEKLKAQPSVVTLNIDRALELVRKDPRFSQADFGSIAKGLVKVKERQVKYDVTVKAGWKEVKPTATSKKPIVIGDRGKPASTEVTESVITLSIATDPPVGVPDSTASQPSQAERKVPKVEAREKHPNYFKNVKKITLPSAESKEKDIDKDKEKEKTELKSIEKAEKENEEGKQAEKEKAAAPVVVAAPVVSSPTTVNLPVVSDEVLLTVKKPSPAPMLEPVQSKDSRPAPVTVGGLGHAKHVEPVVSNDNGTINDLLKKLRTVNDDGTVTENKAYMAEHHIKKFDPKVIGKDDYLTLEMYCDKDPEIPGAGMPAADASKRKTVNVYAHPDKGAVKYSVDKPTANTADDNNRAIERICRLAVDVAKPGTTFTIPKDSPNEKVVKAALLKALGEKYPSFKKEEGKLVVPVDKATAIPVVHTKSDLHR